jgi:uncharacterized protein (DUF2141 family)
VAASPPPETSMTRALLASLAVALALGAVPAEAAKITVTIDGLHSAKGDVFVALFSRAEGFPDGAYSDQHQKVKASLEPITVVFDVAPGLYAVGAYHDENANGKLDTNFIGYPIEGYAMSNGVRIVLSRPRFADAAFQVGDGGAKVALHIEY